MSIRRDPKFQVEGASVSITPAVKYMASQYLADSSFVEDVSQFDFSSSVITTGRLAEKQEQNEIQVGEPLQT